MNWIIHYGDGSRYTDEDGDVFDAPALNVQAISCRTDDPISAKGFYTVFRFDYYWWEPPDWFGGEIFGLFDYLSRPGEKKVVFGRTIGNAEHQAIIDAACTSRELERRAIR